MKRVVLDASAVMSFFENRSGADKVEDAFNDAFAGKLDLLISVVNWGEVYYSVWRTRGESVADQKLQFLAQMRLEIVPADATLTKLAASFRAQHKLPYADCFAAALGKARKAHVMTADADFSCVKNAVDLIVL